MDILSNLSPVTHRGLVNFPGISASSKKKASELLVKDATQHHCFFVPDGRHNHLSHHILAAYDLGAPPSLIQKIYEDEVKTQRPIKLDSSYEHIVITGENWLQYIGNQNAYHGFVIFFSNQLRAIGFHALLDKYLFSDVANKNGVNMLQRMVANGIHAFIHMGYGIEFGDYAMVITGLAQAAIQVSALEEAFNLFDASPNLTNGYNTSESHLKRQSSRGLSLLEVLQQLYDCDILVPPPYDAEASYSRRGVEAFSGKRASEVFRICAQYYTSNLNETEIEQKSEELIWVATLLLFATGKKEENQGSIFVSCICLSYANYKMKLTEICCFARRPKIQPNILMSYTENPRPPVLPSHYKLDKSAIGTPVDDGDYSSWPTMIDAILYAPDAHTVKVLRTLIYATQHFGDTPSGGAIGAWKIGNPNEETLPGTSIMDGSIFVRAAGVLIDYMGWVTYGQTARDDWDRSGLGWDDAWNGHHDAFHKNRV
ncbi:hypothetical protein BDQ17DRAFT_1409195 [Cyathus striatus]|nr:hypothetical protein BDQ17DRAFT_1409195 [Cyathus striatus]